MERILFYANLIGGRCYPVYLQEDAVYSPFFEGKIDVFYLVGGGVVQIYMVKRKEDWERIEEDIYNLWKDNPAIRN